MTGDGRATTTSLPCDVEKVLSKNCQSCHQSPPLFGSPFPLKTREDLMVPGRIDKIIARIHDDAKPMPPPPAARLSAADMATLESWKAAGMPASTEACTTPVKPTDPNKFDCTPDQHLKPSSKWTMPKDKTNAYVCFGVDITAAEKRHIIGIAPRIDNKTIVHHVLLLEAPNAESSVPHECPSGMSTTWRMVYGWAPGAEALGVPKEAGFPLEGTKHYVIQMHYNNVNALEGEQDESGVDFCTTKELRPNDADVIAFGSVKFTIPAQAQNFTQTCDFKVPSNLPEIHAFAAMPHMHQLGKSIDTVLKSTNGSTTSLGTIPKWDFETQYWIPLDVPVKTGDTVQTTCTWTNGTNSPVSFGEKTEDEMCYSFTMYYPRIPNLVSWQLPAAVANCK